VPRQTAARKPWEDLTVNAKARDLMRPVLGARRTEVALVRLNKLEQVGDVAELVRSFLTV